MDTLPERSSLRGRCLELACRLGDDGGSFLTTIFGALPALCTLYSVSVEEIRDTIRSLGSRAHQWPTYDGGDRFPSGEAFLFAEPSCEAVDTRDGVETAGGADVEGAKAG